MRESEDEGAGTALVPTEVHGPFDYNTLAADVAAEARAEIDALKPLLKRHTDDLLEIGHRLTRLKQKAGYGLFGKLVWGELGLTSRSAQNFMKAYAVFGDKCEVISHLPPTVVIAIAAASKPVQDEALRLVQAGEPVQVKTVQDLTKAAKRPKQPKPLEPVIAAIPLPAQDEVERAGPASKPEPASASAARGLRRHPGISGKG